MKIRTLWMVAVSFGLVFFGIVFHVFPNGKLNFEVGRSAVSMGLVHKAFAANASPLPTASELIKLPYEAGEKFVVVQGYNSPPTHIKKDSYAMDLSQDGCDAYGKTAVAAEVGTAMLVQESGYNGGYGTQVLIKHAGNVVSRYAHMIPGTVLIKTGDPVVQGEPLGEIGNTGLVAGAACPTHPGTHIHFAMYDEVADGSFTAHLAEPISGYTNITEGKWYLSDNAMATTSGAVGLSGIIENVANGLFGVSELQSKVSVNTTSSSLVMPSSPNLVMADASASGSANAGSENNLSTSGSSFSNPISQAESSSELSSSLITTSPTSEPTLVSESTKSGASASSGGGGNGSNQTISASPTGGVSVSLSPNNINVTLQSSGNDSSSDMVVSSAPITSSTTSTLLIGTISSSTTATSTTTTTTTTASSTIVSTSTSTVSSSSTASTNIFAISSTAASFNSSTLAIDFSWQPAQNASGTVTYTIYKTDPTNASSVVQVAQTTSTNYSYQLSDADFGLGNSSGSAGGNTSTNNSSSTAASDYFSVQATDEAGDESTVALAPTSIPNWGDAIQSIDTDNSNASWYSDNWYDLGTGFYGTIRSLTFEGFINSSNYFASHLSLQEYLDSDYTQLNQTFPISDNAPFTDGLAKVTILGLDIPLQPNKYYRLTTNQDYQNRSVILAGTSATGTAMWDEYIYGTGIVRHTYSFYPYLSGIMIPNYPPLQPPNPPTGATIQFDSLDSSISFSWRAATDPDTTSSLLTYEVQITTSTAMDAARWIPVGKDLSAAGSVVYGNQYLVGIRAIDDFGNTSQPLVETWNFPAGYAPVPFQLDHSVQLPGGAQKINFAATTTVSGIALWTFVPRGGYCCGQSFVSIHSDDNNSIGDVVASSTPLRIYSGGTDAEELYSFSPSVTLSPGVYWFSLDNGPSQNIQGTEIFGSSDDSYPDGEWSGAPGQDAYFKIQEDVGQ